jgi:hypothetical protein
MLFVNFNQSMFVSFLFELLVLPSDLYHLTKAGLRRGMVDLTRNIMHNRTCVQRPPSGPQICGLCWQVVVVQR